MVMVGGEEEYATSELVGGKLGFLWWLKQNWLYRVPR